MAEKIWQHADFASDTPQTVSRRRSAREVLDLHSLQAG